MQQKRLSLRNETNYAGCTLISNLPKEQQRITSQPFSTKSFAQNFDQNGRFVSDISNYNAYNYQSSKNVVFTPVDTREIQILKQNDIEKNKYYEKPIRGLSLQQPQQVSQQVYLNNKVYYATKTPAFFEASTTTSSSSSSNAKPGFKQEWMTNEAKKRKEYLESIEKGGVSKRASIDSSTIYLKTDLQFETPVQTVQKVQRLVSEQDTSTVSTSNSSNDNSDDQSNESTKTKNIDEIEKQYQRIKLEDTETPARVAAYSRDIFQHLQMREKQLNINQNYMKEQNDINSEMRWILVDWLIEVHYKFKLRQETLFIAIYIIDKYLSLTQITRYKFQLVGVTALFIASKYEEIYPPELQQFSDISDKCCSKKDILQMEGNIINALNFEITVPSSYRFAEWYCRLAELSPKDTCVAFYFVEMALLDTAFLKYSPSNIAASAIYMVNKLNKSQKPWPELLEYDSGYSEQKIRICAKELFVLYQKLQTFHYKTVSIKYSRPQFHKVGLMIINIKSNQM